ncbi:hypothetical protein BDF20DRAFT_916813 [Mycotypha africana]|uniref:uncharacterized protein n=1 Tax=Mycotypha africana TaxID=64632 RepID=UPI00230158C2|nr:uncharacterized protein BDF20DRAFT_916813 [Mycotypha africana]KAI8968263.1 hypothetical protein BDF20DRAFT_916813 [Mycotypha africana]
MSLYTSLSQLPSELLLRIIDFIPDIIDKCHLTQTCKQFNRLLSTNAICWKWLDFSAFECKKVTNSQVLTFLKSNNILLLTPTTALTPPDLASITTNSVITMLDLSGCSYLSEELIMKLCQSLYNLQHLILDGYKSNKSNYSKTLDTLCKNNLEIIRDHVYSAAPLLNLKCKLMEPSNRGTRLNISFTLLSTILCHGLLNIKTLSLQYQDLTSSSFSNPFENSSNENINRPGLNYQSNNSISYLDISSCHIRQPALQSLLRQMGRNVKSLKLLNIELNNLTWLCIGQYCKGLNTLHVSCFEPASVQIIQRVLVSLTLLDDLRITNFKSPDLMNPIIQVLNATRFRKLDLSPKLVIYPNPNYRHRDGSTSSFPSSSPSSLYQPQFKTATSFFVLSNESVQILRTFSQLVELRLCYPVISAKQFNGIISILSPHLKILELRLSSMQVSPINRVIPYDASSTIPEDFLRGLNSCQKLEELSLFSVHVTNDEIQNLFIASTSSLRSTLQYLIINEGGTFIQQDSNIQKILSSMSKLIVFYLGGQQIRTVHYCSKDRKTYS